MLAYAGPSLPLPKGSDQEVGVVYPNVRVWFILMNECSLF